MGKALYDRDQRLWWDFVDAVKLRAKGKCEWCNLRPAQNVHHRFGYGEESTSCLMAVCRACHAHIHGVGPRRAITVAPGSLADCGDHGTGNSDLWKRYLKRD